MVEESEYWKMCRGMFTDAGVLSRGDPVCRSSANIADFAYLLKDGYLLCSLANAIMPSAIQRMHRHPTLQFLCMENISNFLTACSKKFGMKSSDLFQPDDLFYATDFSKVVRTLGILSATKAYKAAGLRELPPPPQSRPPSGGVVKRDSFKQQQPQQQQHASEDEDIYGDLPGRVAQISHENEDYGRMPANEQDDVEDIYESLVKFQTQTRSAKIAERDHAEIASISRAAADKPRRYHILHELLETERNYIDDLYAIIEKFYQPMVASGKWNDGDIRLIFCNVRDLYPMHINLLEKLQNDITGNEGNCISDVFLSMMQELLEYSEYCSNLPDALAKIRQLEDARPDFREFLAEQSKQVKMQFELSDLVNLPMQRVLRYPLLLTELIKHTPDTHPDHQPLQKALKGLKEIAVSINEAKRDKENLKNIADLQSRLTDYAGAELSTYGKLVKDGDLDVRMAGDKKFKMRFVFLFETALLVCATKGARYLYKAAILLDGNSLEDSPNPQGKALHAWALRNSTTRLITCTLQAKTADLKQGWFAAFKTAILNFPDKLAAQQPAAADAAPRGSARHTFKLHTYKSPTFCTHCQSFLWGTINQGFKCQGCNIDCHKKCLSQVSPYCEQRETRRRKPELAWGPAAMPTTSDGRSTTAARSVSDTASGALETSSLVRAAPVSARSVVSRR